MSEAECDRVRERLALGEHKGVEAHLTRCPACRREAEALRGVAAAIAGLDPRVEPPASVDAAIRAVLSGVTARPRPILRPAPAVALAAGGIVSSFVFLSSFFDAIGLGDRGGLFAASAIAVWLAVSAAATVPILIHGVAPSRPDVEEALR